MSDKRKTTYHSFLVNNSPLRVKVLSGAIKSKFPARADGSGAYFVGLEYDGQQFNYTSENDGVAKFLGRYEGQEITIEATGRGEDARINVKGSTENNRETSPEGHSASTRQPSARPEPSIGSSTQGTEKSAINDFKQRIIQIANAFWIIRRGIALEIEQAKKEGFDTPMAMIQAQVSTAFIKLDKSGLIDLLPTKPMWPQEEKQPEGPAPKGTDPAEDPEW